MSTADVIAEPGIAIDRLRNGDHLDQETFHARYENMPRGFRAELVRGVVFVPSPMMSPHGRITHTIGGWLAYYSADLPAIIGYHDATVILSDDDEPQPDAMLILSPEAGGQTHINERNYLEGAPELVIEVADTTESIDLNEKRDAYEAAGVLEYLVACIGESELHSFRLKDGQFVKDLPMRSGVWKSAVFTGLWLDVKAVFESRLDAVFSTVNAGKQTAEFRDFAEQLAVE